MTDLNTHMPQSAARAARLSVAPMMDWTTSDYRVFARTLTKHTLLYTEMVTSGALLQGHHPEPLVAL